MADYKLDLHVGLQLGHFLDLVYVFLLRHCIETLALVMVKPLR